MRFAKIKFMGRAKTILQSEFPYSISARCINREWFNISMSIVWEIYCDQLKRVSKEHGLEVHSFVLMSNHYHLLASTPNANISECMHQFMGQTSRLLTKEGNRINQTYSGRHFKTILHRPSYYLSTYKYIYRNPVTAGICEKVEEYPYSTLRGLLNPVEKKIPILEDSTFLEDPVGTLQWLNTSPSTDALEAVKYALKRQYFQSKKMRSSNQLILKENDIL